MASSWVESWSHLPKRSPESQCLDSRYPHPARPARFICNFLVVLRTFTGWGEQNNFGFSIDQYIVLDAMAFFLAAVENGLGLWVLGPRNGPFCAILQEKVPLFWRQM